MKKLNHVLEIKSPVTGSLCVPAAGGSVAIMGCSFANEFFDGNLGMDKRERKSLNIHLSTDLSSHVN